MMPREKIIMKLLYGTTNAGKLAVMKRSLSALPRIELIGLKQIEEELLKEGKGLPQVAETGNTPLENARMKAWAYYEALKIPVFSCDTGLYLEGIPEELQPGIHVRNINGRCLTDEEMTEYYRSLAEQYGDITARYKNAICFVLDKEHIYESMEDSLSGEPFILTSIPHPKRQEGFPLDCLSKNIAAGRYYYDMGEYRQDDVALNRGFLEFFRKIFQQNNLLL